MESADPTVHEGVVDGITAFWAELPPPLSVALIFRVGYYDETLRTHGITHLVEHLALHPLRETEQPYGGQVSGDCLLFHCTGSESELVDFFRALSQHLRTVPVDRLDAEAGVLISEENTKHRTTWAECILRSFFGPNGPGVAAFAQYGLEFLRAEAVQAWADRHCVRRNAALMLTGAPPSTLGIDLPEGTYQPHTLPRAELGYRPQQLEMLDHQTDGICLGALSERTAGAVLSLEVLNRRLIQRLRHDLGLVYETTAAYQPLDADTSFIYAGADAREDHLDETARAYMTTVNALLDQGPTEDEIEALRRAVRRHAEQDPAVLTREELERVTAWRLLDYEDTTAAQLMEEQLTATADDIGSAFRAAVGCAGVVAPEHAGLDLPTRVPRSDEPVEGRTFRSRRTIEGNLDRLVVGPTGVAGRTAGRWVTLPWEGLLLALRTDPFSWAFLHENGSEMQLHVRGWWRWRKLRKLLEESVPHDVRSPDAVARQVRDKDPAQKERDRRVTASDLVASLRAQGMTRDSIHEELLGRGFSRMEADSALDS